jgi:tRNA-splicing ligase RtcB
MDAAFRAVAEAQRSGLVLREIREEIAAVVKNPSAFESHERYRDLARVLSDSLHRGGAPLGTDVGRDRPVSYRIWGTDHDAEALRQMERAARLPIAVRGALMPDAHVGYGLPIGGVLATDAAVIPYAVGMDIACRMKMTVPELAVSALSEQRDRLRAALERETRFGVGSEFKNRREHSVMDEDWSVSPVTRRLKDKAWAQLGTSGSGNHFVEYGVLTILAEGLGLPPGEYLALLSHSGSRGTGGEVATHYSRLAQRLHPELPRDMSHLAWFDLAQQEGREYWAAMELMGRYAAANHELIHRHVLRALGVESMIDVENHHNYAWREKHETPDGTLREMIVHRKGATPANRGALGIIPGSMGAPGYVVRGLGEPASLHSAAHGAGRRMSRKKAKQTYSWHELRRILRERKVELISAGLDEVPMAYKDIEVVMAAQSDLVEKLARFEPRVVKMAPGGEKPED